MVSITKSTIIQTIRVENPTHEQEKELKNEGFERYGYHSDSIQNWERVLEENNKPQEIEFSREPDIMEESDEDRGNESESIN